MIWSSFSSWMRKPRSILHPARRESIWTILFFISAISLHANFFSDRIMKTIPVPIEHSKYWRSLQGYENTRMGWVDYPWSCRSLESWQSHDLFADEPIWWSESISAAKTRTTTKKEDGGIYRGSSVNNIPQDILQWQARVCLSVCAARWLFMTGRRRTAELRLDLKNKVLAGCHRREANIDLHAVSRNPMLCLWGTHIYTLAVFALPPHRMGNTMRSEATVITNQWCAPWECLTRNIHWKYLNVSKDDDSVAW